MNRIEKMKQLIETELSPTFLNITDNSQAHAGHAGTSTGLGHYTLEIGSEKFKGKSKVQCHQMIYAALGDMMQTDIHALRILINPNEY